MKCRYSIARSFALIGFLIVASVASAQQSQNDDRGVVPGKAYQQGDLDTVNLFNGNLNVAIPIGQTYHVGGQLSYGITLHYGGNPWEYATEDTTQLINNQSVTTTRNWSYPTRTANAGMGWRLSFGSLFVASGYSGSYTASDGSEHAFSAKLHPNDAGEPVYSAPVGTDPETSYYTTDGTYLRLRKRNTSSGVKYEIAFPNGIVHTFDLYGNFEQMADANGNWMKVQYDVRPQGDSYAGWGLWKISDSAGRQHYVRFRPGVSYHELTSHQSVGHQVVDQVDMAAFNGTRAVYQLEYNSGVGTTWQVSRRYVQALDSSVGPTVPAYMLTGIFLPSSLGRYTFSYDLGDQSTMSNPATGGASGNLRTLVTPTNARFEWTYRVYTFPPADPTGVRHIKEFHTKVPGVATRVVTDLTAGTTLSDTRYEPTLMATIPATEEQVRVDHVDESGVVVNATRHYFSTCAASCPNPGEYGLPLSRAAASVGGAYLSTEFLTPGATSGTFVVQRSTYVRYEMDGRADTVIAEWSQDRNRRLVYSKTVYEDQSTTETTLSDFDGYGHYRTSTTRGVTPGYDETTTKFVNYNSTSGTFGLDASGNKTGTFTRMSPTSPWILGTFSRTRTTSQPAGGTATFSETALCFEAHGLLSGQRKYTAFNSTAVQGTDLLSLFTYDGAGNLVKERYFGGDAPVGGAYAPAPTASVCGDTTSPERYAIDRVYLSGSLAREHYSDASGSLSFQNVDNTIDLNTGLVASSTAGATVGTNGVSSADGIVTTYTYDALGRPLTAAPQAGAGAKTQYTYGLMPPSVEVMMLRNASPNDVLSRTKTAMDALGRATLETRYLPSAALSYRKTTYDRLGRQKSVSEAEGVNPPTHSTVFDYDAFGRVTKVTRPDGSLTSTAYTGISGLSRTTKVATDTDGNGAPILVDATTTESYDGKSRLRRLVEPSSAITDYSYDVGDHLTNVCMNVSFNGCGQTRLFNYDNRGFLVSEQQPELGSSGNGSVSYTYDPRGHLLRRYEGSALGPFDTFSTYDRAERLLEVIQTALVGGQQRRLKVFEYGTANTSTDYRNGKITRAVRFNWLDSVDYAIKIAETYTYAGVGGRADSRTTLDYACIISGGGCNVIEAGGQNERFTQTFTYDDLGKTAGLSYPACEHAACAGAGLPQRTLTNTYANGMLTGVAPSIGMNPASISYWPNGMVNEVAHGNGVKDTIDIDSKSSMARPSAIHTTGAQDQSACVAPTFTTQPASALTTASSPVTLASAAGGQNGQTIGFAWYSTANPSTPISGAVASSISVNPQTTTGYWVVASNSCGSQRSATATVTVCGTPSVTTQPASATITRTMRTTLSAAFSSPAPLNYQWYTVSGTGSLSAISGATGTSLTVQPDNTTTYRLRASNLCGTVDSANATITVQSPPGGTNVLVTWNGSQMQLTFSPVVAAGGLSGYDYQRLPDGLTVSVSPPTGGGSFVSVFANAVAGEAYAYRIRGVDSRGVAGPWSNYDLATAMTFTDDPVTGGVTPIRGVHIAEMRRAIDAIRRMSGLPAFWSSYVNPTGPILASQMTELRIVLDDARSLVGFPSVTYTRPIVPPYPRVNNADMNELRGGVR